ncbi:MAG: ABC-F family ATP-binding cassette domain-containing protein [Actinomycetaceae bacterium]|nr:ABC-F family ATP-binding cassette domain-containing protein [Actinomycetaceae bacterium]
MSFLMGLKEAGLRAGVRRILGGVTLSLEDGDRIGIVGPNGAGKSTLLHLLAGTSEPTEGHRSARGGVRVALLDQADDVTEGVTVRRRVYGDVSDHVWASEAAQRDIAAGLLSDIDLDADVSRLSGGQRRRVSLARCLSAPSDVIVLDEPTNHLDVEGVDWLARHLLARRGDHGALVVVTHDRWFLDAVCTRMWEVVPAIDPGDERPQIPGRVEEYDGSYAAYVLARAERARLAEQAARKRDNLMRKELAWLRRGAPARTSKPRFRIEAAEALIADSPPPRDSVELARMATQRLGKRVIDVDDVGFAYSHEGGRREIFTGVTWRLAPGERVGIVGVNGAGKTTLLKLLAGEVEPLAGEVRRGKTVEVAQLSQSTHELDRLADLRVNEAVAQVKNSVVIDGKEVSASKLVERLGFTRERAWTPVADLSGGERRRLQLMRILMGEPNVLLLDEPTNDLDTDTLAAFEDLLDTFPGTLVVVSHDRYFLERVTDHQVALLGDGRIRDLPGGVEEYLELRRKSLSADAAVASRGERTRGLTGRQRREAEKEMASLERRMSKCEQAIAKLEEEMALGASVAEPDVGRLSELARMVEQHRLDHEELEAAWLSVGERLESEG